MLLRTVLYVEGKPFRSYGMEERAAMVQDRFLLRNGERTWRPNNVTLEQLNKIVPFNGDTQ